MDILLTHDQQGDAIDAALKRCVADKELSPAHEIAAESCRAQLRKVARWAETPFDVEGRPPWSSKKRHSAACRAFGRLCTQEGNVWMDDASCRKCWTAWSLTENVQALRAAGGE